MTFREDIRQQVAEFRASINQQIQTKQQSCPHLQVGHYAESGRFPVRVCLDCGFEEQGSWWSYSGPYLQKNGTLYDGWSRKDFADNPLLKVQDGRTVMILNGEEAYRSIRVFGV